MTEKEAREKEGEARSEERGAASLCQVSIQTRLKQEEDVVVDEEEQEQEQHKIKTRQK